MVLTVSSVWHDYVLPAITQPRSGNEKIKRKPDELLQEDAEYEAAMTKCTAEKPKSLACSKL